LKVLTYVTLSYIIFTVYSTFEDALYT